MQNETHQDAMEDQIADSLRRAFAERAGEKVPDRFLDLIRQLREQEDSSDDK